MENENVYMEDVFENEEAIKIELDFSEESRLMDSLDYSNDMQDLISCYN